MKLSRTNGRGLDLFQQLTRGRRLGIGSPQSLEIAIFDGARPFAWETLPSLSRPHAIPVTLAGRPHPFPSRTRKLSSPAPKILRGQPFGKIGRRRDCCVYGPPEGSACVYPPRHGRNPGRGADDV